MLTSQPPAPGPREGCFSSPSLNVPTREVGVLKVRPTQGRVGIRRVSPRGSVEWCPGPGSPEAGAAAVASALRLKRSAIKKGKSRRDVWMEGSR